MGGGHSGGKLGVASFYGHGGKRKALGHGGAGTVQPVKGNVGAPGGKAGADALV